ncbi:tubulin-specific chaperone C [Diabrotica virgifera virgifera]|uniref:Tubulin-specific chaperone C n=1 Tax=Diabrotica virgifera virgifera TaxID=50390 RepID=A0A6P7F6S6_DIAVI|nr:tubulin-specific chaperone C [Diabrotica virgifera virgifera]
MNSTITFENTNEKANKLNLLTKREVERQLNLQKRKDNKDSLVAGNEKLEFFETLFAEKRSYIENMIDLSKSVPVNELPDHFNEILKEIVTLQKYVAASSIFIRNYDMQKCQNILQELTVRTKQVEDELLPKKKFSFKNKVKQKAQNSEIKSKSIDDVDFKPKIEPVKNVTGFFNKCNEHLALDNSELLKKDVSIEKLDSCTVSLQGSPSTLHLNYLRNCRIFSGPVSTSIFAENCENCILVIACQQLRLHNSKNTDIYLYVTSRAIMEDCKDINVAPYNWKYEGIESDFESASFDTAVNNWTCIDDFNWLNQKHSPNWKEIDEKDRIQSWNHYL